MKTRIRTTLTTLALALAASPALAAVQYTVTELGSLGGSYTYASKINANGQVVGFANTAGGQDHAFITSANGQGMTDLGTWGGIYSHASDVNDSGQVVGEYIDGNKQLRPFITGANGTGMTDLGTLGGSRGVAFGVNSSGQAVGFSNTPSLNVYGYGNPFITGPNGVGMTNLGTLGGSYGSYSYASAINDKGQVVGTDAFAFITGANGVGKTSLGTLVGFDFSSAAGINSSGQVAGYVNTYDYQNGQAFITGANGVGMIGLGTLGGTNSAALDINDSGQVVGWSYVASGDQHAFITGANGQGMVDLNSLVTFGDPYGWLASADGINESGQIVANDGFGRSYLLTPMTVAAPIPEADTYALMALGMGLVGWIARRRGPAGALSASTA